jgi:hypothetical protein
VTRLGASVDECPAQSAAGSKSSGNAEAVGPFVSFSLRNHATIRLRIEALSRTKMLWQQPPSAAAFGAELTLAGQPRRSRLPVRHHSSHANRVIAKRPTAKGAAIFTRCRGLS